MPIVAESPPLVFGGTPTPVPVITPSPTPPPRVTPTPKPVSQPGVVPVITPGIEPGVSNFVTRHKQFINRIDELSTCFKRVELNEFSDQEFSDHTQVAMQDKYIAQEKEMYCSMQGVNALTKTLRRLGEE